MTCDMGHLNSCGPMRKPQAKSQANDRDTCPQIGKQQRNQHQPVTVRRTRSPWRERNQKRGADRLNAHRRKYSYIKGAKRLTRRVRVGQSLNRTANPVITTSRSRTIALIGPRFRMIGNKNIPSEISCHGSNQKKAGRRPPPLPATQCHRSCLWCSATAHRLLCETHRWRGGFPQSGPLAIRGSEPGLRDHQRIVGPSITSITPCSTLSCP